MRLQQYLAHAGVASRRKSEELIAAGKVTVNGIAVTEMGVQVEGTEDIRVDGRRVTAEDEEKVVIMYYKPRGVISAASDDRGRPVVTDAVKDLGLRLYPVGRLDMDSEGLILLTNDGELANRLTHPSYEVEKTYIASLREHITGEAIQRLRHGVEIEGKVTAPAEVKRLESNGPHEKISVTIHEGRNRQVRKMLAAVGNDVVRLVRVSEGPVSLKGLKVGNWRFLTEKEISMLKNDRG